MVEQTGSSSSQYLRGVARQASMSRLTRGYSLLRSADSVMARPLEPRGTDKKGDVRAAVCACTC